MIGHAIPVYRGYSSQYGYGLGNVLGGILRAAIPIVGKIAKKAGGQLLDTGLNYLQSSVLKRKASTAPSLSSKRRKTKRVKRVVSHPRLSHKRKTPPGKPVKRLTRSTPGRDIFSK